MIEERRKRKDGLSSFFFRFFQEWIFKLFPLFFVAFGNTPRKFAHATKERLSFSDRNRAAGIEDVEGVRGFEDVIVRGDEQTLREAGVGFGGEEIVHLTGALDVGDLVIIFGMFELLAADDLAVGDARAPLFIPDGFGVIERDEDAFKPVGDLDRDGIKRDAAHLLEVGELRDLLPVEPDLPTQTPRGDGGLFPVVLHKTDVVLARVNAKRLERLEIQLLRISRVGLEDDLILRVLLKTIWILTVAPIIGTDRRLDVRDVPRFGSEHAQKGGGIHRPCADLGVVGLSDEASVRCPEGLEVEDDGLEGGVHFRFTNWHLGFNGLRIGWSDEIIPYPIYVSRFE